MAPYAPFNYTLSLLDIPSLDTPTPLPRRSLIPTVISLSTATTPPQVTPAASSTATLPHRGVGPVILEPSSSSNGSLNAASTTPTHQDHAPLHPGFIAILVIPLLLLVFGFFYVRRRAKQRSAQRIPPPPPLANGVDDPSHVPTDPEALNISQLPRDRIRAMNAAQGKTVPSSPLPDATIFSPRLPSPPPTQSPRSHWGYLSALSPRSASEPPSPMESVMTFASDTSVQPLTPSTPSFFPPLETISESPQQISSLSSEKKEEHGAKMEGRFTWDFRCRGLVDSFSRFSFGSVLDISPSNNVPITSDDALNPSSDIQAPHVEKDKTSADGNGNIVGQIENGSLKCGLATSAANSISPSSIISGETSLAGVLNSSPPPKSGPSNAECATSAPSPVSDSDSALDTPEAPSLPGLSTPTIVTPAQTSPIPHDVKGVPQNFLIASGLDLDLGNDFAPLVVQFGLLEATNDSDLASPPDLPCVSTPKRVRKRPVLSKPNHRVLAPVSSSLKIFVPSPAVFASLPVCATEESFSVLSPRSDDCSLSPMATPGINTRSKVFLNNSTGLKRASSEVNLRSLKRIGLSPSKNALSAASNFKTLTLLGNKAAIVDSCPLDSAANTSSEDTVILCSSPSMPLSVELACLSSIAKRIKTKPV